MIELLLRLPTGQQIDLIVVWEDGLGEWHKARMVLEGLAAELGVTLSQHVREPA